MTTTNLEQYLGTPVAFFPVYDEVQGNATILYQRNGETITLGRSISIVLRDYLALYGLEKRLLQKVYGAKVAVKSRIVPLPVNLSRTLMPLRVRHTISKHDGAYAYLEYESIDLSSLVKDGVYTCFRLANFELRALISPEVFRASLAYCALAQDSYRNRHHLKNIPFSIMTA